MAQSPWLTRPDLAELIDMQIRATGPMSIATYMGLCLTHPRHGYYSSGRPIGAAGDFITAPEISQMFGELIGFFIVNLWQQMGEPKSFTLLELGPGRGTLMADMLRAASQRRRLRRRAAPPAVRDRTPILQAEQDKRLGKLLALLGRRDRRRQRRPAASSSPTNSSTPCRSASSCATDDGWHERLVGLDRRQARLRPVADPDRRIRRPARACAAPTPAKSTKLAPRRRRSHAAPRPQGRAAGRRHPRHRLRLRRNPDRRDPAGRAPPRLRRSARSARRNRHLRPRRFRRPRRRRQAPPASPSRRSPTQGDFLSRLGIGERAKALAAPIPAKPPTSPAPSSG